MIIERFFRVIAESKSLLSLGSDSEFVLSLALFKMMESLEIKDIDTMIRGLEQELKGIEVSEIMVTTPSPDLSVQSEVITITEDEIIATLPTTAVPKTEPVVQKEAVEVSPPVTEDRIIENAPTPSIQEKMTPADPESTVKQVITQPSTPAVNPHQKTFDTLVKKLYDRDYDLGACFERNISFENFEDNKLTWGSMAEGTDKKTLITHWGLINMFVKDTFGFDTKIINMPKKKVDTPKVEKEAPLAKELPVHEDSDSASMIEDIEMKSSCIAPEAGETEAAKEKDPSTLLEEPMIKEAIALFDPKKVRIKRNT